MVLADLPSALLDCPKWFTSFSRSRLRHLYVRPLQVGHVRTLRAFFSWLIREGLIEDNPARDLKPPKISKKVVSTLSDKEILSVLKIFSLANAFEVRNQTIFMLLLDTGLKIGELVNLRMEDAHINEGFLKVLGKGRRNALCLLAVMPKKPCSDTCLDIGQNRLTLKSIKFFSPFKAVL